MSTGYIVCTALDFSEVSNTQRWHYHVATLFLHSKYSFGDPSCMIYSCMQQWRQLRWRAAVAAGPWSYQVGLCSLSHRPVACSECTDDLSTKTPSHTAAPQLEWWWEDTENFSILLQNYYVALLLLNFIHRTLRVSTFCSSERPTCCHWLNTA